MITIFSIPKPFSDPHISLIQKNAIKSWLALGSCQIILMGDDFGVKEIALELGVTHTSVLKNEFGTPLLNDAFEKAREMSRFETLVYVNADIILTKDFLKIISRIPKTDFLIFGKRLDVDIKENIDFQNNEWDKNLILKGKIHSPAGIDYFIFNKKSFKNLPPFSVGRIGWDNWMIWNARKNKMPAIDATEISPVIHQNHEYSGVNVQDQRKKNPEAKKHMSYFKNESQIFTIEDADWKMTHAGLKKKRLYWLPQLKRYLRTMFRR